MTMNMDEQQELSKVIVARHDPDRLCWAEDGEILVAAAPSVKAKVRLRKGDHFFVGLHTGQPALYGWVAAAPSGLKVKDLIEKALASPGRVDLGNQESDVRNQILLTCEAAEILDVEKPVVSDFATRSLEDKTKVQTVHRVFFKKK